MSSTGTESITIHVNGAPVTVPSGATVAAAVYASGASRFRRSVTGEPRGPLCGMGICFECRVTIDGARGRRACLERVSPGMRVTTRE